MSANRSRATATASVTAGRASCCAAQPSFPRASTRSSSYRTEGIAAAVAVHGQNALEAVPLHQPIQRGPIHRRDARGARDVVAALRDEPREIAPLEFREQPLAEFERRYLT